MLAVKGFKFQRGVSPLLPFLNAKFDDKMRCQTSLYMSRKLSIRPSLDDIERISRGQAATKRGVGSRAVPHRLNALERKEWDLAKRRRYLLVRGTGWRKERGDSPLANIYRNYCDALDIPCVSVYRSIQEDESNILIDKVIIDFSPLRISDVREIVEACLKDSREISSLISIEDSSDISKLGWSVDTDKLFQEEAIWRIPVYCVVAKFSDRTDSKRFAESIALRYCKCESKTSNEVFIDDDEDTIIN